MGRVKTDTGAPAGPPFRGPCPDSDTPGRGNAATRPRPMAISGHAPTHPAMLSPTHRNDFIISNLKATEWPGASPPPPSTLSVGSRATAPWLALNPLHACLLVLSLEKVTPDLERVCPSLSTWIQTQDESRVSFSSAEHCWQALSHAADLASFLAFTTTGLFGTPYFEEGYRRLLPAHSAPRALAAMQYWSGKSLVGHLARLAGRRENLERAGLNWRNGTAGMDEAAMSAAWATLLDYKFAQNPEQAALLLKTGQNILVDDGRQPCAQVMAARQRLLERCTIIKIVI